MFFSANIYWMYCGINNVLIVISKWYIDLVNQHYYSNGIEEHMFNYYL